MYLVLRIEIYAGSAFARCITTGVKVAVALETADLGVCKIRKVSYRKTAALSLPLPRSPTFVCVSALFMSPPLISRVLRGSRCVFSILLSISREETKGEEGSGKIVKGRDENFIWTESNAVKLESGFAPGLLSALLWLAYFHHLRNRCSTKITRLPTIA